MRLKKGSKVEVLSTEEVATGSWRCAEIISGNGRTYTVKYSRFSNTTSEMLEKVPRMAIRPSPPPLEGLDHWVSGDLVEVFHNLSWKTAVVADVLDGDYFLVRLLGLMEEFEVQKSHLRVRQSWENGAWFMVGQCSRSCAMPKGKRQKDTRTKQCSTDSKIQNITLSTREKKRSPFASSYVGSCNGAAQKVRVVEKDGHFQRMFLENASQVSEKVDAHFFSNNRRNEPYRRVDSDSCGSSIASCSANSIDVHNLPFSFTKHRKEEDNDSLCSDAESFCGPELMLEVGSGSDAEPFGGQGYAKEDKSVVGVHRSALHAYRCALEALYASGPLTWEEELKMSNLRHSLQISDDEHLMELRNLIAT